MVHWKKPKVRGVTFTPEPWAALPEERVLRLVRCRLELPGFRTKEVILVTTLLDSDLYPPQALGQLYDRRWAMELTLRPIKITLQMDQLSCKTPANLDREIRIHFLVHNLVRRLMLEAARRHGVPLERVSFAGSLAVARRYSEALLQAPSKAKREALREELLRVLAADLVPDRPGRREPRAGKRRPKPYPRAVSDKAPDKAGFWPCLIVPAGLQPDLSAAVVIQEEPAGGIDVLQNHAFEGEPFEGDRVLNPSAESSIGG